jgi:adenosine kinase
VRIALTGSIANDYLMTFPGRFSEQLVGDQLERLSLSFLVDSLEVRRGGVAANIAFGMGALGHRPVLVGSVGHDFPPDYEAWLTRHNVDIESMHVSQELHTCRFLCTNDQAESQIASFYPGAMTEARNLELAPVAERVGGLDLVVVSPNDPVAMRRHTDEAKHLGIGVVADPSQQLAFLQGDDIRPLIDGATYLISNDYERALIEQKTGWTSDEIMSRVEVRVTTHGPKGCHIEREGEPLVEVGAVPVTAGVELEPTGAGDAFRAGFLAGIAWGFDLERSAQLGSLLGVMALETVGPQEYEVTREVARRRLAGPYGDAVAGEIVARLPA